MIKIDYTNSRSIHEQIEDGIKKLIVNKILQADEQLPSVRDLSVSLTVNPNTVQKAYKLLEGEGYIYSVKGKGNFVAPANHTKDAKKINELYRTLRETIESLMYLGETKDQIEKEIQQVKEDKQ